MYLPSPLQQLQYIFLLQLKLLLYEINITAKRVYTYIFLFKIKTVEYNQPCCFICNGTETEFINVFATSISVSTIDVLLVNNLRFSSAAIIDFNNDICGE